MYKRETLGSRLGFILLSAGCAIGLGNVWRFPYIVGKNGGAGFVLIYLIFLILLGLPMMTIEFSIGRGSKQSIGNGLEKLEKQGAKWHLWGPTAIVGNYILIMFYSCIAGWIISYFISSLVGTFDNLDTTDIAKVFSSLTANPLKQTIWMAVAVSISMLVVAIGLEKGVERITKYIMLTLLFIMLLLTIHSLTLSGTAEGLKFYLIPNFKSMKEIGFFTILYEALGQAFFTLSVGIGSMAIFGSYIDDKHSLAGESVRIIALDTFVAITAGIIIFPACFSYDVAPDQGPSLLFITLPNIFSQMKGGRIWASLFFLFMSFAALSTLIAVFENIISYWIDVKKMSRRKACLINYILILVLSLPCILGFNILSSIQPFGEGSNILDLEDFIVSNIMLPLGCLLFVLFVTRKSGWGWDNFLQEANKGEGLKFPSKAKFYVSYIVPILIAIIMAKGILDKLI
ncbi:sodium-dependent transporter [Bullifex porci]|uniref:sodium-dependent transporter n=1 Tax=Bullifex porci TaxID=2606638 RepID=UPI0023F40DD5|nr:sodium-dependent transporter [Bullifex porci]MDD7588770.1 sodium-dependent transporter [Bullifex porci]